MNTLVRLTFGFALVLIVLGVGSYFITPEESRSFTALLPAIVGVLLLGTGLGTTRPSMGRVSGIASALLVIILAVGSLRGVILFFQAITNNEEITLAMVVQVIVVVLSVAYLAAVGLHMRQRRAHS